MPDLLYHLVKSRYQRLRKPKTKHQLRPRHQQLGRQPLEKAAHALVLYHLPHNLEAAFRVIEIAVLNSRFDDVEGCGDNKGGGCAGDRGDEVLVPAGCVVVDEFEEVFFCKGRAAEELGDELDSFKSFFFWNEMERGCLQRMSLGRFLRLSSLRPGRDPFLRLLLSLRRPGP